MVQDILLLIATTVWVLYCLLELFLIVVLIFIKDRSKTCSTRGVSVVVAARNEEHNILNCLSSLNQQNYPKDLIEFIIGDDDSQDNTAAIILSYIKDKPQFSYYKIDCSIAGLKGKQNVLAQLIPNAKGEIILITDADVTQQPSWAAQMVAGFNDPKVGCVSSGTIVKTSKIWVGAQTIDWLVGIATIRVFHELGLPITAVGNNMGVTKKAYLEVGGYESLPFSITEDYLLFRAILDKGYKSKWTLNPDIINYSAPTIGILNLFEQRLRWLKGGMTAPLYARAAFGIFSMTLPILIICFLITRNILLLYYIAGFWLLDFIFIAISTFKISQIKIILNFPLYIIHRMLNVLVFPFYALFKKKVIWKGRAYFY